MPDKLHPHGKTYRFVVEKKTTNGVYTHTLREATPKDEHFITISAHSDAMAWDRVVRQVNPREPWRVKGRSRVRRAIWGRFKQYEREEILEKRLCTPSDNIPAMKSFAQQLS